MAHSLLAATSRGAAAPAEVLYITDIAMGGSDVCVCESQQAAGACGVVVCDSWLGAYDVHDEGSAPHRWAPLLY